MSTATITTSTPAPRELPDFFTVDFGGRQLGVYHEDAERPTCSHVTPIKTGARWDGMRMRPTFDYLACECEAFGLLDGQPLCSQHLCAISKDLVTAVDAVTAGLIVPFKTEQIKGLGMGAPLLREHFRITVPADCADTEAERDEIAFNEARELCWTYHCPANWVIESRTGGSDITYTIILES